MTMVSSSSRFFNVRSIIPPTPPTTLKLHASKLDMAIQFNFPSNQLFGDTRAQINQIWGHQYLNSMATLSTAWESCWVLLFLLDLFCVFCAMGPFLPAFYTARYVEIHSPTLSLLWLSLPQSFRIYDIL